MPITDETKRRLLTFREKLVVADFLESGAVEGVFKYKSVTDLCNTIAHLLNKDSGAISESNVRTTAKDVGVTLQCVDPGQSLMATNARIDRLEGVLVRALARIDELDRIYLEAGAPPSTVSALGHNSTGKRA